MPNRKSVGNALRALPALLATLAAFASTAAHANSLTFSGSICNGGQSCNNSAPIDQSYGDVSGQVDVGYRVVNDDGTTFLSYLKYWGSGYSGLTPGFAWGAGDRFSEISFTPLNGFSVTIDSLRIGSNGSADTTVSVLDASRATRHCAGQRTSSTWPARASSGRRRA